MRIIPDVGRIAFFRPALSDTVAMDMNGAPLAALIVAVHNDQLVNIVGWDCHGVMFTRERVTVVQEGETPPLRDSFVQLTRTLYADRNP